MELETRCRIEYKSVTQDPIYGTQVTTWALLGVRWCNLQDTLPSRAERQISDVVAAVNTTRIRLRYCTDIDSSMRIIVNRPNPTVYHIVSGPAIIGQREWIEMMLEKVST